MTKREQHVHQLEDYDGNDGSYLYGCPDCLSREDECVALRKELWLRHGANDCLLYGDDGEMQCNACRIDFKRDPVEQILARLHERDLDRFDEIERVRKRNERLERVAVAAAPFQFNCNENRPVPEGWCSCCDLRHALAALEDDDG